VDIADATEAVAVTDAEGAAAADAEALVDEVVVDEAGLSQATPESPSTTPTNERRYRRMGGNGRRSVALNQPIG
jgi:hypothetical protein